MGALSKLRDCGWELVTEDHPRYRHILDTTPRTVFEVYSDDNYVPSDEDKREAKTANRFTRLRTLYILEPNPLQSYWNDLLHQRPHVQLSKEKCHRLMKLVRKENERRTDCGLELAEVVVASSADELCRHGDFIVRNNLDPDLVLGHIENWGEIITRVTESPKKEDRNHRRLDLGACGHRNSTLNDDGLWKPTSHKVSTTPFGKQLMSDIWTALRAADPEATEGVYDDLERRSFFAALYTPEGQPGVLESAAVAASKFHEADLVPTTDEYFGFHVDVSNDRKDPKYSPVGVISFLLINAKGELFRIAFICYGKQSCYDYMEKNGRIGPVVKEVEAFYNSLPNIRKLVLPELFPTESEPHGKFLFGSHMQKTILHSSACHAIRCLLQSRKWLQKDPLYLIGLVYSSQVSNRPQHFFHETMYLVNHSPAWLKEGMDPFEFTHGHYTHMWDVMQDPSKQCAEYTTRARYIPVYVPRPSVTQIANSMKALARAVVEINRIKEKVEYDPTFYYHRTVEILKQSTWPEKRMDLHDPMPACGCLGIGPLLSQHLIAILSLLGILPVIFLSCAEVSATTRPGKYLVSHCNFSPKNFLRETTKLLEGVQERIKQPQIVAEEAVCRWKIRREGGRESNGDWIPPNCPLLYLEEPESFGRCKSRKRLPLHIRMLNPNHTITTVPPLIFNLRALDSLCREYSREDSAKYWKTAETDQKQPRRQKSQAKKPPQPEKLFPSARGKPLPTPDPGWVVSTPRPDQNLVLESAYHAVRLLRRNRNEKDKTPADREIFHIHKVEIQPRSPLPPPDPRSRSRELTKNDLWGTKLDKVSRTEKQQQQACSDGRNETPLMGGRHKKRTFFCYAVRRVGGDSPPATFPLHRGISFVHSDGRRYFLSQDAARESASLYDIVTHGEEYFNCGSKFAKEVLTPPCDLNRKCLKSDVSSVEREASIVAIKVFPEPRRGDPSRLPVMVGISYETGGYGLCFTNQQGQAISQVYPVEPPSYGTRENRDRQGRNREEEVPYNGILRHRNSGNRTEVEVSWCEGTRTWELLKEFRSSGSHWHLFRYAQSQELLARAPWKNLTAWKAHSLGVSYYLSNKCHSNIEAARKQESSLKRARPNRVTRERRKIKKHRGI